MTPRVFALSAATAVMILAVVGCSVETPTFDPATAYSPESLTQELVFRYKEFKANPGAAKQRTTPATDKEATKESRATKTVEVATLNDVLDETIGKASLVPNLGKAEVIEKIRDLVKASNQLGEADLTELSQKLSERFGH
jgi:hypothetical protein